MVNLTPNAISHLCTDASLDDYAPVVQVLAIKQATKSRPEDRDRCRLVLSDGRHYTFFLMASYLNGLVEAHQLLKHDVVRLSNCTRNLVQDKEILIVHELAIVERREGRIGTPKCLDIGTTPSVHPCPSPPLKRCNTSTVNKISGRPTTKGFTKVGEPRERRSDFAPIKELTPYSSRWTIKAAVTQKSDVRTWNKASGSGQFFNVVLMDETGTIKATAFKETSDRLFDQIEEGRAYIISNGAIKEANPTWNKTSHQYEIVWDQNTIIQACDEPTTLPLPGQGCTPLSNLQQLPQGTICNVMGLLIHTGELETVLAKKTQTELYKKVLTIADRSGFSCRVTLWAQIAEDFEASEQTIIEFRRVKVEDFNGRSLGFQSSTSKMLFNPDCEEAHTLRGWYGTLDSPFRFQPCQSGTGSGSSSGASKGDNVMTMEEVRSSNLGMKGPAYFTAKLRISRTVREGTLAYPACTAESCRKKMILDDGLWRCQKCGNESTEPQWRYCTRIFGEDLTGGAWFSIFSPAADELFEHTAADLQGLKEENAPELPFKLKIPCSKLYHFRCKAEEDVFDNQSRVKYTIQEALPMDYHTEIKHMVARIKTYDA